MTIEQIQSLPAGDEINRLIAKKIFGWTDYSDEMWQHMRAWLIQRREFNWQPDMPEACTPRMMMDVEGNSRWPPEYSIRTEYAFMVLNEFPYFTVKKTLHEIYVEIGDLENSAHSTSDRFELSVCRAALKIKGGAK